MPRKKKKSILERKPSLLFTESPVHVEKNIPSPVLCARHPPTADAVQIEDLQSLAWVSPQFQHGSVSVCHRKTRTTRMRRRHSTVGVSSQVAFTNNKENTVVKQTANHLKKYQSLKFLGDKRCFTSIAEDVEITIDSGTASETETHEHDNNRDSNCNRTEDVGARKSPVKRLFASQLQKAAQCFNYPTDICSEKSNPNNRQFLELSDTSEDEIHTADDNGTLKPRRSTRIKHLQTLLALDSTPPCSRNKTLHILAPDTPETQYGWSIRQKQLNLHRDMQS